MTAARTLEPRVVLIGASTGGPQALQSILSRLPTDYPVPICVVQHATPGFLRAFGRWLDGTTALDVRIAEDRAQLTGGSVLLAPEDHHLAFGAGGAVQLLSTDRRNGHRPSASVMFESAAEVFQAKSISILLTGMGRDGADGLKAVSDQGGTTIAQSEDTCVVYGMPREAVELGAVRWVLPPETIADVLLEVDK